MLKRIIITIFTMLISYSGLFAAEAWEKSYGTRNTTNDIFFIDKNTGWAVSSDGIVVHTTDGGDTWTEQYAGTNVRMTSLSFINKTTGWACGMDGTVIYTNDAGENWQDRCIEPLTDLRQVLFLNENDGWTVGEKGLIMRTHNGGKTWGKIASGTDIVLDNICFADNLNGWIGGTKWDYDSNPWEKHGVLLHTTDSGNNWTLTDEFKDNAIYDIYFVNSYLGFISGDDGFLTKTTNGGKTWEVQETPVDDEPIYSMSFLNENEGWATGGWRTQGFVLNKTEKKDKIDSSKTDNKSENLGVNNISIDEDGAVVVTGIIMDRQPMSEAVKNDCGIILHTSDGGITWEHISSIHELDYIVKIQFFDKNTGFLCGGNRGGVYKSVSGGK
ncbi:MAG: hypothetical protein KAH48_07085 [Chlorobi bacterium]|nr:hypothetical protein [Chlorobiota bacterium]